MAFYENITSQIKRFEHNFHQIDESRTELLNQLADYISGELKNKNKVNLIFICTHNSRRSHISQIWAQTAADFYEIKNIFCYSGGTESTAFNPRAVNALIINGFDITKSDQSQNPIYLVKYSDSHNPIKCFSKVYSDSFNPQNNFSAIMTCSDADENCPVVMGAEARFPVRYEDPKCMMIHLLKNLST